MQSVLPVPMNSQNFNKMSKIIESNKIEVTFLQETMKKEIERDRETYAYPANIGKAKLHRHASKFGFRRDLKGEIPVVCPCCKLRMDNEPIEICYSTSENSLEVDQNYEEFKLTPGIAVFFSFLKATIFYIFLLAAFAGYYIFSSQICQIQEFDASFHLFQCQAKQEEDQATLQKKQNVVTILFLVSMVVITIFLFIYKKSKNAWHRKIYSKNLTEESYTILISNIPVLDFPSPGQKKSQFFYRRHIEQYLQTCIKKWVEGSDEWQKQSESNQSDYLQVLQKNGGQLKSRQIVKSISLCYNLNRLQIIDDTKDILIEKHDQVNNEDEPFIETIKDPKNDDRFSTLPKKIQFINDCKIVLNNQYSSDNSFLFNLTHFVGHAFVSFQYQHYKTFFLETYQNNSKAFQYNGNYLKITPACHPNDINWKNLRLSNAQKQRLHITTYLIISLIIIIEFILLAGLNLVLYHPHSILDMPFTESPRVFTIVMSVVIMITNAILKIFIKKQVVNQRHKTKINQITTYINKSIIAQVFSTCVVIYFLNLVMTTNDNLEYYANHFFLISSSREILWQLINPVWMGRELRRWWRYRNNDNTHQVNKFQYKLNKQFEYPTYELPNRYSYFIYKIYVAAFFAYPAPLGLVVTFITLALMYWIDKTNLFKRSSLYENGNLAVSNHAVKVIQFSLLFYAASWLFFSDLNQGKVSIKTFIGIGFAFLYVLFTLAAPQKLKRWMVGREAASDKYIYDECLSDGKFNDTYWSTNPATCLVQQSSVTKKQTVTNPALLYRFAQPSEFSHLL